MYYYNNFIINKIRRANRRLLIIIAIALIILIISILSLSLYKNQQNFFLNKIFETFRFLPDRTWGILIFFSSIIGLIYIIIYIRNIHPKLNPTYKSIEKYGELNSMLKIMQDDYNNFHKNFADTIITDSWLYIKDRYKFKVFSLDEIIWFYERQSKMYPGSWASKPSVSYTIFFYKNDGNYFAISGKSQKECHEIMKLIQSKRPWILAGYSEELYYDFKAYKEQVIQEVENRKKRILKNKSKE